MRLTISGFTEPRGIGSQALLTINVTSSIDLSNVVLNINLRQAHGWPSEGIELAGDSMPWNGDMLAGVPVILEMVVNATEVGCGVVESWQKPLDMICGLAQLR